MIIGHLGLAYAARARWPRASLGWLLVATMAPDLLRIVLDVFGADPWTGNQYSHLLPWSLLLAAAVALLALAVRRDVTSAVVIGALVLSHVALDMVSGNKPLWVGGPVGLNLQRYQQLEFVIEAAFLVTGWYLLRRREPRTLITRRGVLAMLLLVEGVYLTRSLIGRPYATRCIEYPLQPCWIRRHDPPPT
jgi:hypothetical protein